MLHNTLNVYYRIVNTENSKNIDNQLDNLFKLLDYCTKETINVITNSQTISALQMSSTILFKNERTDFSKNYVGKFTYNNKTVSIFLE